MTREISVDVAIIGGGMGACAAERALSEAGLTVIMTETSDWIGGQMTSQGVAALDEHAHIETFGCTLSFAQLRAAIRQSYQQREGAPAIMRQSVLGPDKPLNPGNGWVSRLCFLPERGHEILSAACRAPRLLETVPIQAERAADTLTAVTVRAADGTETRLRAPYFLDATELGDVLPLSGTAYSTGSAENPNETQAITWCLAVAYRPGEDHTIAPPEGYEAFRAGQPYTLAPKGRDGQPVIYRMFGESEQGNPPFWTYRRLHDGALLGGDDVALINWVSNDYYGGNLIDAPPAERARYLDEARRLSLGFLYWLQTECPRDDDPTRRGYPELQLRPDVMGTPDGLAKAPYIREARRIDALTHITPEAISAEHNPGARARHQWDSVGIGWYSMDLHPCVDNPTASLYAPTRPFQIPLGALIPRDAANLLAAGKNIGTDHLSNGAYRVHPVEWAIGEAAGTLAAFCLLENMTPHALYRDPWQVWRLQAQLVRRGCPIVWALDVPPEHRAFLATQLLLVRGLIVADSPRWHRLDIGLDAPLGDSIDWAKLRALADELNQRTGTRHITPAALQPDWNWLQVCGLFHTPLLDALAT